MLFDKKKEVKKCRETVPLRRILQTPRKPITWQGCMYKKYHKHDMSNLHMYVLMYKHIMGAVPIEKLIHSCGETKNTILASEALK